MRKNVLIYGAIAGVAVSIVMLYTMNNLSHCEGSLDYNRSMLIGYASMLVTLSLVFVGIRNYRDKYNGGVISFGKASKVGILMVLVAATIYVAAWLIDYYFFLPGFAEKMSARELADLKASGASQASIDEKTKELAKMTAIMNNPFLHALMAYMEILPVGVIVTLISSLILKRKAQ